MGAEVTQFSQRPWAARFAEMGDTSEKKFLEFCDGKAERWGFNRPEGLNITRLPARVRAAPDFVTNDGFVECMGLGRKQMLQVKDEKLGVLRFWNDLMPTRVFVWDSHKKRSCIISVPALGRLVNTPDLCSFEYFDGRKLVFCVPADAVFDAAS